MSHPQRISFNPDPPRCGEDVEICYNFADSGLDETLLEIDIEPGSDDDTTELVSLSVPCVVLRVPDGAMTIKVIDQMDKSLPNARVTQPPPGGD